MYDPVDEPMFEQEFAGLKSLGEFDANRRLDRSGTGESDQGSRLGENEIAQRRETRGDASHRRIRQDRNE